SRFSSIWRFRSRIQKFRYTVEMLRFCGFPPADRLSRRPVLETDVDDALIACSAARFPTVPSSRWLPHGYVGMPRRYLGADLSPDWGGKVELPWPTRSRFENALLQLFFSPRPTSKSCSNASGGFSLPIPIAAPSRASRPALSAVTLGAAKVPRIANGTPIRRTLPRFG